MRIAQIHTRYLEPGGEDAVVRRERRLLTELGHDVASIEFVNPDTTREQVRDLAAASWNRRSARELAQRVPDGVDAFHVHNTWYRASPAVVAEARSRAPVVMTLHNYRRSCLNAYLFREGGICTDCVGTAPWRGVVYRCYRDSTIASLGMALATTSNRVFHQLDRSVDRYLVLSDFAAELAAESGIPSGKLVRHDNFVEDPGPRTCAPTASDVVLAVGRLSPEKGFATLVRAWNDNAPPGLTLEVVGDGPDADLLRAIAGPSVRFPGRLEADEVQRRMRSSRAVAVPSAWFEGQPLVLLESLAAGLPVISSDHPPLREVLSGAGQVLVPAGGWAGALDALADREWLERASTTARERWAEAFSPEVAGARLTAIYREVVDAAGQPPG